MGKINEKKRGRPKVEIYLNDVIDLASEGNTCETIARALGISKSTLFGRKDIREAYETGRAMLEVNLRHWQMECAKSGNPQMLMFLGKQYLGQSEKQVVADEKTGKLSDLIDGLKEPLENDLHAEATGLDGAMADE